MSHLPTVTRVGLGKFQLRMLYLTTTLLWSSGAIWLYLHFFGAVQGILGMQPNPNQPLWLKVHGAMAMIFLVVFGALIPNHIRLGWRVKSQRLSGAIMISICTLLTFTAWGLYYSWTDEIREMMSRWHWIIGLSFPVVMSLHAYFARLKLRSHQSSTSI